MKHFLCTRFNLKNEDWKTDREGLNVLSDEWMNQRLDLFEKYCLPSVLNQVNKNFKWVIFFDVDTSLIIRERIKIYSNKGINFSAIYIDGMNSLVDALRKFVIENIYKEDKFIITSRLDNDDAIHENFIETIQKLSKAEHGTVIDIIKGYQMNISNNIYEFRNHFKYFNPFISVVESSDIAETVFSKMHFEWNDSKSLIAYNKKQLWIETIHDKNKSNTVRVNFPLVQQIKLEEFGIQEELQFHKKRKVMIHNCRLLFIKAITQIIQKMNKY